MKEIETINLDQFADDQHYSAEELYDCEDGLVFGKRRKKIIAHVAECAICNKVLSGIQYYRSNVSEDRDAYLEYVNDTTEIEKKLKLLMDNTPSEEADSDDGKIRRLESPAKKSTVVRMTTYFAPIAVAAALIGIFVAPLFKADSSFNFNNNDMVIANYKGDESPIPELFVQSFNEENYEKALSIDFTNEELNNPELQYYVALSHLSIKAMTEEETRGDDENLIEAKKALKQVLKTNSAKSINANYYLAQIAMEEQEYAKAKTYITAYLQHYPEHKKAKRLLKKINNKN